MIKFSIPIFLHFRIQQVFLKYHAKFQSITNSITHVFWAFISENLAPPLIFVVPSLGWELEKMTSFSQKYRMGWNYNNNLCRNCKNLWAKAFVILMRTSMLIFIIILTRVVFLRKWCHFLQFSTQTRNKEN